MANDLRITLLSNLPPLIPSAKGFVELAEVAELEGNGT